MTPLASLYSGSNGGASSLSDLFTPLAPHVRWRLPRPAQVDCAAFANRRSHEAPPHAWDAVATRRVVRAITLHDEGQGRLRLDVHVKSALHKMVRNIVGLLLSVGSGRTAADAVPALLARRERSLLPPPAPAHGLTLENVYYRHGWDGAYSHPLHVSELLEAEGGGVDEGWAAACLADAECVLDF